MRELRLALAWVVLFVFFAALVWALGALWWILALAIAVAAVLIWAIGVIADQL